MLKRHKGRSLLCRATRSSDCFGIYLLKMLWKDIPFVLAGAASD